MAKKAKTLTALSDLKPCPYNPRNIDAESAAGLQTSLAEFGDISSIVLNRRTGFLVAGHQRVAALNVLYGDLPIVDGVITTPTGERFAVRVVDWPKEKADLAMIAANNAFIAGDFTQGLRDICAGLDEQFADLTKKLRFDELLDDMPAEPSSGLTDPDAVPEPPAEPVTKRGDLWLLGEHRLLCGDSTKADDVARLMGGEKAALCFTSPPYAQQRDYEGEAKELVKDWDGLMRGVFANLPMADDGQVLVNLGLIHRDGEWIPYWDGWIEWMSQQGWRRFGWYVWDKGESGRKDGSRLATEHEWVFHFGKKAVDPIKAEQCVSAGQHQMKAVNYSARDGAHRTYDRPVVINDTKSRGSICHVRRTSVASVDHPALFPVRLADWFVGSWPGSVLDPFLGSGTTMISAEMLGRRAYCLEIEPRYVDVAVKRWEQFTGRKAVLEAATSSKKLRIARELSLTAPAASP